MFCIRLFAVFCLSAVALSHNEEKYDKFKSFFEVTEKLLDHEKEIATLRAQLEESRAIIAYMNGTQHRSSKDIAHLSFATSNAGTYTRWGRSSCPNNATLVYEGYVGGSMFTNSGAAVNYLCLPNNPDWNDNKETPSNVALIYGAEYETHGSVFNALSEHDAPCVVCRVPRNNIIMVPGKNVCHQHYHLEYKGYIMAGYPGHKAASEYVCVDGEAERIVDSSAANQNGILFYFVWAKCGSLKCPPYKEGQELTCAVCSYKP